MAGFTGGEETEEKGGGEGTRFVFCLLPQQTCKQQGDEAVNVNSSTCAFHTINALTPTC